VWILEHGRVGDTAPMLLRVCRLGSSFDEGKVFSVSWVARSFSWQLDVLYIPLFFIIFHCLHVTFVSRSFVPIFSLHFFSFFSLGFGGRNCLRYHRFFVMAEVLLLFLLSPLVSIRSTGMEI